MSGVGLLSSTSLFIFIGFFLLEFSFGVVVVDVDSKDKIKGVLLHNKLLLEELPLLLCYLHVK